MCGISGYYNFSSKGFGNEQVLTKANNSMSKRGPDSAGVITWDHVGLGHRRLSIIDTSFNASQPFTDISNSYTIVFNGEIFNFNYLRDHILEGKYKTQLKSTSDTEILLYLYIQMGEDFLKQLEGFFALAIYNHNNQSLFMSRDRFGKKPFYYYQDDHTLFFGSELKALIEAGIPRQINYQSIYHYFQFNYIVGFESIFKNVKKLTPGCFIKVENNTISEEKRYYNLAFSKTELSYDEAKKTLYQLMEESVHKRMISDVPLGTFLSGGIDSSVVSALAAMQKPDLQTFSIGYKDNPVYDESKYALAVADKYKTKHHIFYLEPKDYNESLRDILDYLDEPFADSSAIPIYILSKKTKAFVTVSLSGDGGDEVFAGYNKHWAEHQAFHPGFKKKLVQLAQPLWQMLPKNRHTLLGNKIRQLNRFASAANMSQADRYWYWASIMHKNELQKLFTSYVQNEITNASLEWTKQQFTGHLINKNLTGVLLSDINMVLPGDMLYKVDMMSMANSLEIRSPFLDHKIVDFAFSLPDEYKINSKLKKRIVQDTFRNILPEELYNRPKQGFELPLLHWLKTDLKDDIYNVYLEPGFIKSQGIFNPNTIEEIKNKMMSNNPEFIHATVWALVVFQHWWKKYMN